MNILLVYPQCPDTFWSYKHALRFIGRRAVEPPLGLLTVAALLPPTFTVRLVDLNIAPLRAADLAWADYVFLSAMTVQQNSVCEIIQRCQAARVPVVAGGPLFTSQPEAFPEVAHLVLNEAELTLPPFLADLQAGCPRRIYRTSQYADLTTSPVPRWDLADLHRYAQTSIQYSRGCPFACEFCDVTALLGHQPRVKTATQILAELDSLRRHGWHDAIFFVDDNLIGNPRQVKTELLPALIAWQHRHGPVAFNAQVSINLADDPELIDLMIRAGFDMVFIGIETPDAPTLAACHKTQNTHRDLLADVRRLQHAGLQVQGGFIVGFDSDSPAVFQRQIEFIQASGIVTAMVGVLQAFAGTRLHARLQRENRLRGSTSGNNVALATNFVPRMDPLVLQAGYRRVLQTLYTPAGYYARLRTFLRHFRPRPVKRALRWRDLRAFLQSLVQLGLLGAERWQYWRLLLWTLWHRPPLFSTAVFLAIVGYHYRKVCQTAFPKTDLLRSARPARPAPSPAPLGP
jgi:radical SAM superfamily enzyme YgiQ (UPF0313 family)